MHKRLLFIGLLIVGIALLSGCELLDQIIDAIDGGGTPGGGITYGEPSGGEIIKVHVLFGFEATISEQLSPDAPITTYEGRITASVQPDTGTYNKATKTFTADSWDDGEWYSNTYLEITLSETEEHVAYFYVRVTHSVWTIYGYIWTYVHELRGYNIAHSHWSEDRTLRYYEAVAVGPGSFDLLTYERWTEWGDETELDEWAYSHQDIIPHPDNFIEIWVEYSESQP